MTYDTVLASGNAVFGDQAVERGCRPLNAWRLRDESLLEYRRTRVGASWH